MIKKETLRGMCKEELESHLEHVKGVLQEKEDESKQVVWELCRDGMTEAYSEHKQSLTEIALNLIKRSSVNQSEVDVSLRKVIVRVSDIDEDLVV